MTSAEPRSTILALNSESSSLKFGLYRIEASIAKVLLSGGAEPIRGREDRFSAKDGSGEVLVSELANLETAGTPSHELEKFLPTATRSNGPQSDIASYMAARTLRQHCLIDEGVQHQLESAAAFAPLHNPPALTVIRFAQEHFPGAPQVDCFDTAFHSAMPEVLPIPAEFRSDGIRRYGFHVRPGDAHAGDVHFGLYEYSLAPIIIAF
jgi:acetate kinase